MAENHSLSSDPQWYRDAVIYELHVRAFYDSDGDGIGDFRGLVEKLDYLEALGVTAVWLLPFYPSPLRDDGYDIADYRKVHPAYGTLADFQSFLDQAHSRGIRVITELVVNHTSDQHPWFQRARRAPKGSPEREFYVWSDDPDKYSETRVIFQDFEPSNWTWDPVAEQYFWHRFYHHQPDLNFDNPRVHEELFDILDFWMEMGVDGMRLDAIPYLYEREGTNCENLPETHAFLKKLRAHVDEKFDNRMLLAEANQWPEDAAAYFGDGDECHMNFHFPIMPRLFMSLRMEDRFPVLDILEQTPEIPEGCQWAMFLRNHDELTLEMVTDEERDYMYRVYARDERARINLGIRRRLAPLLENHRGKIELMNSLLFSLPGTPVLYYGDEIGMGDNIYLGDRNGMRTPMQWSGDRNAGFSRANPQRLYLPVVIDPEYHYESVNVEAQLGNRSSLLWWMRRLIRLRKEHKAFGRGSLKWIRPDNERVLAFLRSWEGETDDGEGGGKRGGEREDLLIVANLSRFVQHVSLDLDAFEGCHPVELFGRSHLPPIGSEPYYLTLGPHAFYALSIESDRTRTAAPEPRAASATGEEVAGPGALGAPVFHLRASWAEIFDEPHTDELDRVILEYLRPRRWFGGKSMAVRSGSMVNRIPVESAGGRWEAVLFEVDYFQEDAETYFLPLCVARDGSGNSILEERPDSVVARIEIGRSEGGGEGGSGEAAAVRDVDEILYLVDATASDDFAWDLLEAALRDRRVEGPHGTVLTGIVSEAGREQASDLDRRGTVRIVEGEQSNTSLVFDDKWILKIFRSVQGGINPDREVGALLTELEFPNAPAHLAAVEIQGAHPEPATLAVVHRFVPDAIDAWEHTQKELQRFFEEVLASDTDPQDLPTPKPEYLVDPEADIPAPVYAAIGAFLESAALLGRRTGELHRTLATSDAGEAFRPEPLTRLYQRSVYQSMRNLTGQSFRRIERIWPSLEEDVGEAAERILENRTAILERFRRILGRKIDGYRIRGHGDYHLGQVLYTGKDWVIIDFEGEPSRPLGERRLKRSPLRDVAGMLRSFDYAATAALFQLSGGAVVVDPLGALEGWSRFWYQWVAASFLKAYYAEVDDAGLLPDVAEDRDVLLEVYLLEKALYELEYEIDNRPDWIRIPVGGILRLLEGEEAVLTTVRTSGAGG